MPGLGWGMGAGWLWVPKSLQFSTVLVRQALRAWLARIPGPQRLAWQARSLVPKALWREIESMLFQGRGPGGRIGLVVGVEPWLGVSLGQINVSASKET